MNSYGTLYICATPIGNLEDITYRVVRILNEVDLIAAEDTRHTIKLLNRFNIKKPMISYFEHNKRERGEEIVAKIKEGINVALVSDAGMPAISDPGEDLVRLCIEEEIKVVPLPGANAALTGLVSSGIATGRFTFQGFLSMNKKNRKEHLTSIKTYPETLIFYEAPHKLKSTLKDLYEHFGDRNITLCRELTKVYEEFIHTNLMDACSLYQENSPKGEFVLVIDGAKEVLNEDAFCDVSLEKLYLKYIEQNMDDKDALKKAAKDKGITKREAYSLLKVNKV